MANKINVKAPEFFQIWAEEPDSRNEYPLDPHDVVLDACAGCNKGTLMVMTRFMT